MMRKFIAAIKRELHFDTGDPPEHRIKSETVSCENYELDSLLMRLPQELKYEILFWLSPNDICKCRLISKFWRDLIDIDKVWLHLYRTQFGETVSKPVYFLSWKDYFINRAKLIEWDNELKASQIELSNDNRTAKDATASNQRYKWATVLAKPTWKNSIHYCEIRIDKACPSTVNTIKIGFGLCDAKPVLLYNCPFGYCYDGFNRAEDECDETCVLMADGNVMVNGKPCKSSHRGHPWNEGDHVGMKLDYSKSRLQFYLNGKPQGPQIRLKCRKEYFVALSLISGNQVTIQDIPRYLPIEG